MLFIKEVSVTEDGDALRARTVRNGKVDIVLVGRGNEGRTGEHISLDPLLHRCGPKQPREDRLAGILTDLVVVRIDADDQRDARKTRQCEAEKPQIERIPDPNDADALAAYQPEQADEKAQLAQQEV